MNKQKAGSVTGVDYFGHSSAQDLLLSYGSQSETGVSASYNETDGKQVNKKIFKRNAVFGHFGCYGGEKGGLCESLSKIWKIKTIGSKGTTSYKPIGQGIWKPSSTGGYVGYP